MRPEMMHALAQCEFGGRPLLTAAALQLYDSGFVVSLNHTLSLLLLEAALQLPHLVGELFFAGSFGHALVLLLARVQGLVVAWIN